MDTTTAKRQRRLRQRRAKAGLRQLTVYLPQSQVTRIDARARTQGTGRNAVLSALIGAAFRAEQAASNPGWLSDLVSALGVFESVWRTSRSTAVLAMVRSAHGSVDRAYQAMPAELRTSDGGRRLASWLAQMGVVFRS